MPSIPLELEDFSWWTIEYNSRSVVGLSNTIGMTYPVDGELIQKTETEMENLVSLISINFIRLWISWLSLPNQFQCLTRTLGFSLVLQSSPFLQLKTLNHSVTAVMAPKSCSTIYLALSPTYWVWISFFDV